MALLHVLRHGPQLYTLFVVLLSILVLVKVSMAIVVRTC